MAEHRGNDQAAGLRNLFGKRVTPLVAFVCALGASDRIKVMVRIADGLVKAGNTVTLLDEHPAPGNVSSAYGVTGRIDFISVVRGVCTLPEAVESPRCGMGILAAIRATHADVLVEETARIPAHLNFLRDSADMIMIDSISRIGRVLSSVACCADQVVVIVSPVTADLTQAYAQIKRIAQEHRGVLIRVAVASARDVKEARGIFDNLYRVAHDHLGLHLQYLGALLTPGAPDFSLAMERSTPMTESQVNFGAVYRASVRLGIEDSVV